MRVWPSMIGCGLLHSRSSGLQVNRIRNSISALSQDSVAFGLPQPHLDRTRLCEIPDSELNPDYILHREDLRRHLHSTARAKSLRGASLSGPGLADLVVALVDALNARELPTSGSMLEAFNLQLLSEAAEEHAEALSALHLPADEVCVSACAHLHFEALMLHLHSRGVVQNAMQAL